MPEFELSKAPGEITKLLMSRGSGALPLQWTAHQNLLARRTLDQKDNLGLFGNVEVRDEPMAAAVRGLLYLFTGWTAEAIQYAALASPGEHAYIAGLCERHQGHPDAAKSWFQKIESQAIFVPLGERVLQMLRSEADSAIKRFREIIEQHKAWEPHAFVDLYESARAGRLLSVGERLVCKLQDIEFEMLFVRYFEGATGRNIAKTKVVNEVDEQRREQEYRRRMAEKRERIERERKKAEARKAAEQREEKRKPKTELPPKDPKVKVLCPKCGKLVFVAEGLRGKPARCVSCSALFLVPDKKPGDGQGKKTLQVSGRR